MILLAIPYSQKPEILSSSQKLMNRLAILFNLVLKHVKLLCLFKESMISFFEYNLGGWVYYNK